VTNALPKSAPVMGEQPGPPEPELTFIFFDIVNSSVMLQDHPQRATAGVTLLERLKNGAGEHGASHANFTGDGFMAAFDSAGGAIAFALHVVATVADPNKYPSGVEPVLIRTGLHTGPATKVGSGELVGVTTSATSRISDTANPGQIVVTKQTIDAAAGDLGSISVHELGWFRVRDFAREFLLYGIHATDPELAATPPVGDSATAVDPSQLSMWSVKLLNHPLRQAMDQLDGIAGVEGARTSLRSMLTRALLARAYVPYPDMVPLDLDSVFIGSRGVGKSLVANRLAAALNALGVLGSSEVIDVDSLEYANLTPSDAGRFLTANGGHLLFFKDPDRVATLVRQDPSWSRVHGGSFTQLMDHLNGQRRKLRRNELAPGEAIYVVLAARTKQTVDTLHDWDVGFGELYGQPIVFPDLDTSQLCDVFLRLARESRYDLTATNRQQVTNAIKQLPKDQRNARGVTWLFENTRANFFARLMYPGDTPTEDPYVPGPPGALAGKTLSPEDITVDIRSPR